MDEKIEWVDPDGTAIELDYEWNLTGRFAPPVDLFEDITPFVPGATVREAKARPREFTIAFWVHADSEVELRQALRQVVYLMDPQRGRGYIRVTGLDEGVRQIKCRVFGGLGLDEKIADTSGPTMQRVEATFRAVDPYWEDPEDLPPVVFDTGLPPTFFPFFPLRLASSEIVAKATVNNTGDVSAYPKWTITGPGNSIVLVNKTTGEFLDFGSTTLGNGETITVNTDPDMRSVLKNGSTNLFGSLAVLSTLWTFARGENEIELQMNGSSTTSKLQLTYRRRYLSP